jgi:hypothetical protein
VNEEAWDRKTDHLSLEIIIEGTNHEERGKEEQRRNRRR